MHPSAYIFATTALEDPDVAGRRVVEVGAYNYNGSARRVIEAMGPASYVGTDAQPGPGVDLVCPAEKLPGELGEDSADVVVATELLEHAEAWRAAVTGMVEVLAPGGLLLLTTRSPGFPYHPHPEDHWRFTVDHMDGVAEACGLEVLRLEPDPDPSQPGVFLLARKPLGWDAAGMAEGLAVVTPWPPRLPVVQDVRQLGKVRVPGVLIAVVIGNGGREGNPLVKPPVDAFGLLRRLPASLVQKLR